MIVATHMDGVLVIDKPQGLTSHDVVATVRRLTGQRRVGHTGTLDPMATGVLPLVLGQATRLARFLAASRKRYEATIVLGLATDTYDAEGQVTGGVRAETPDAPLPPERDVRAALARFHGDLPQVPPAYSAKKIGGVAAHRKARQGAALPQLAAVAVTVHDLVVTRVEADRVQLDLEVSPGFYVRSLAHDLGVALGCGAHLGALRRTASGEFTLAAAIRLETLADTRAGHGLVSLEALLCWAPTVRLTEAGARRARHGQPVAEADTTVDSRPGGPGLAGPVRLIDADGRLLGVAERGPGAPRWPLHPSVVLTYD